MMVKAYLFRELFSSGFGELMALIELLNPRIEFFYTLFLVGGHCDELSVSVGKLIGRQAEDNTKASYTISTTGECNGGCGASPLTTHQPTEEPHTDAGYHTPPLRAAKMT